MGQLNEFLGLGLKMPEHPPQATRRAVQPSSPRSAVANDCHWCGHSCAALRLAAHHEENPASIVAVVLATLLAQLLHWPVATIGSKFGGIPSGWPGWHLPAVSRCHA